VGRTTELGRIADRHYVSDKPKEAKKDSDAAMKIHEEAFLQVIGGAMAKAL
jgi:hypothetical protein